MSLRHRGVELKNFPGLPASIDLQLLLPASWLAGPECFPGTPLPSCSTAVLSRRTLRFFNTVACRPDSFDSILNGGCVIILIFVRDITSGKKKKRVLRSLWKNLREKNRWKA